MEKQTKNLRTATAKQNKKAITRKLSPYRYTICAELIGWDIPDKTIGFRLNALSPTLAITQLIQKLGTLLHDLNTGRVEL